MRDHLIESLKFYENTWKKFPHLAQTWNFEERLDLPSKMIQFALDREKCFERTELSGHFTGSAMVVNHDLTKVLLTHHRKLGMWLQLGGHADGEPDLAKVASMEAHEESGLQTLNFLNFWDSAFNVTHTRAIPFDLDVHLIPESKGVPEHLHYDVRYLVMGDHREAPVVSEESHDVAWFPLDDARKLTNETSMQRQFSKIAALKHALRGI